MKKIILGLLVVLIFGIININPVSAKCTAETLGSAECPSNPNTPISNNEKNSNSSDTTNSQEGNGSLNSVVDCSNLIGCEDSDPKPGIDETFIWKTFIPYFIKKLLEAGAGIAVLTIVYSAVLLVTSGGEEDAKTKAVQNITYATIGLLVMILSRAIVSIVTSLPLS